MTYNFKLENLLIDQIKIKNENDLKIPQGSFEYIYKNKNSVDIERIKKHYKVSRDEVIDQIKIKEGLITVIDKLIVEEHDGIYVGRLERLNIKDIEVDQELYTLYAKNKKEKNLFKDGMFAEMVLESNLSKTYPFYISDDFFEPLEYMEINIEKFKDAFNENTLKKRINLILNTLGYDPYELLFWEKIFIIIRLITFCEPSYHLIELGKRGVGKNYLYKLFNSRAEVITGTATKANLFYDENKSRNGSILKNDVVVFNEIGDLKFKEDSIVAGLQSYMSGEEISKGKKILLGTSLVFMGNINNPELVIENDEILIGQLHKQFDKGALLDRFCYIIPNWGMREMKDNFYIKSGQKSIPLNYFTKLLNELRNLEIKELEETIDLKNIAPEASTRDKISIVRTISGLIKILNIGEMPSTEELKAYIAIALKGRYLLNKQMALMNSDNYKDKKLSPILNSDLIDSLGEFVCEVEGLDYSKFSDFIPNRIEIKKRREFQYYALDFLGIEKNKRLVAGSNDYKYGYQNRDNNYSGYDYFIDFHAVGRDNLFGESFIWKLQNKEYNLNYDWKSKELEYDESVVYRYKKDLPEELKCKCEGYAYLSRDETHYYCEYCESELEIKEIKKQFLEKGII